MAGGTLFGGLLDRCTVSPFAEVLKKYTPNSLDGTSYFLNVTNLKRSDLNTDILSYPVQVCFCRQGQPDCSYEPHTEYAKKGQPFKVPLVAVDQVKNTIPFSTICSSVSSGVAGLNEGQSSQSTNESCTELEYNISLHMILKHCSYMLKVHVIILGYLNAPFKLKFLPCQCPIGFQISKQTDS